MKKTLNRFLMFLCLLVISAELRAWEGMAMPRLRVEGRYLKDSHGNIVNLHGFAQTYSPWFNEHGKYWTNYDVAGCLKYNKRLIDEIMKAGWKMNFVRMHMDPYWSNVPGKPTTGENDISAYSSVRFEKYLDQVFIPMAEYAVSKGLYVVMRPPGVCPEKIKVNDSYHLYLQRVWKIVASHPKLRNHPNIMFELANEPINILGPDGTYGASSQGHFDKLKEYFQKIVDIIRAQGCDNILWIPGLGYQSLYKGYAVNPIEGSNIGYAVHIYPGWFGSGNGYANFQKGWDDDVKPVADFAPICVTEMDWADEKYNASWGKEHTGTAGGSGFGANFKKITDDSGNVSWLLFTGPEWLAKFKDEAPAPGEEYTFLTDPEACPWPVYHWYIDYATENYPRPDFTYRSHSDNGDGTYTNPVIFADFPDPDVIRVGDWFYMVSTTMHIFPGATILKSRDLVNWEYCCNPLERIELSDAYNLENGQNRYGHGQWATALQYHDGKFYMLFSTLDEGGYLLTATDIDGDWEMKKLQEGFYDPGILFDDNGKTYVVYGINKLRIAEVDEDFNKVPGGDKEVASFSFREGLEGSKLYKIGGYYYIYATYGGWPAFQTVFRSKDIYGPYEEKKLIDDGNIHQGALVETQTGEWWTMLFADRGAYGRLPNLQPVTWKDGWPEIGENGKGVTTYRKPSVGRDYPICSLPTNDNFRHYRLGMQWGWNHNPDKSRWSLTERAGYLRMHTASVSGALHEAKNTLTQRIMGYGEDLAGSYGTVKMETGSMLEGDIAGLAVFQDPYAFIGVKVIGGERHIVYGVSQVTSADGKKELTGPAVEGDVIYLRTVTDYNTSKATFWYSTDNTDYRRFGDEFEMKYNLTVFTGNKFAIFNYATASLGGYVDVDWFSTEPAYDESFYYDNSFTGYSEESLTLKELSIDGGDEVTLLTGTSSSVAVKAVYADGHTEDVTMAAQYENTDPSVVSIVNGRMQALKDGESIVTVSYTGPLGHNCSRTVKVIATTFPLTSALFNPNIWETGSFNENTRTLITGKYGFGGWTYNNGVDLSEYKYLVAKFGNSESGSFSLRLFDENSYWTKPATYDIRGSRQVVVKLHEAYKTKDDGTKVKFDPSHVYIVGFWSTGGKPLIIDKVYLTNADDYSEPLSVQDIISGEDVSVDVYTLQGICVRRQVSRGEAVKGLPAGMYVVGGKLIAVGGYGNR
ncbi:family 43 glycosylhydrolase [Xylanibacter muris]|uniref:Family 43 glycosylhydrolase n=1 Tax=Xylanibacter muris TaxID=2736290 RepID=A0ABX2AJU3_9BACT|nr:family 43 glycosylhydrolase [Xylanibacter muris]NPD90767.1 family 43 glycosylhydrolase [Xylanibacter muris]